MTTTASSDRSDFSSIEEDTDNPQTSNFYKTLNLSGQNLETVPVSYVKPSRGYDPSYVQIFHLNNNQFNKIPLEITNFTNLRELDLSSNDLYELPKHLAVLISLKTLTLRSNKLDSSVHLNVLVQLKLLESLDLGGNRLTEVPQCLVELPRLTSLFLGANNISYLPYAIGTMKGLKTLYLGGNQLQEIPATIGRLSKLSCLSLCENKLETIPSTIADLNQLQSLSLHNNRLKTLPTEIVKLRNLKHLSLRSNPLVVGFIHDIPFAPPTLKELSGRVVKQDSLTYNFPGLIPTNLVSYLDSASECLNPKCHGVYFESRVEHVKFVDFCGKFHVPLLQYLCSPQCGNGAPVATSSAESSSESDIEMDTGNKDKLKKVLLG